MTNNNQTQITTTFTTVEYDPKQGQIHIGADNSIIFNASDELVQAWEEENFFDLLKDEIKSVLPNAYLMSDNFEEWGYNSTWKVNN